MTTSRLYSVASGQCLVRDSSEVDEFERTRAQRESRAGILFILDPDRREIRGVVPARRRTQELFYAIVRFTNDEQLRIERFLGAVADIFEKREGWEIRTKTSEGSLFQPHTPNEFDFMNHTDGFEDHMEVLECLVGEIQDKTPESTITVDVANSEVAISLICLLQKSAAVSVSDCGPLIIARESDVDAGSPNVLFRIRDEIERAEIADSTGEERPSEGVDSSNSRCEQSNHSDLGMAAFFPWQIWKQTVSSGVLFPIVVGGIVLFVIASGVDSIIFQAIGLIVVLAFGWFLGLR